MIWWLALGILPVFAASVLHYFWGAVHELSHLAALKILFRKDLLDYDIRLKWHRLEEQNVWVPASITYTLARGETDREHGIVALAPYLVHATSAVLFMCGGFFEEPALRVAWMFFWALGAVDLVIAARTTNPYSDLYHVSECFDIPIKRVKKAAYAWAGFCLSTGLFLCIW